MSNYTIKDFIKEFNYMPGIDEFLEMFDTSDEMFDMMYPTVREAFLEAFNDPSFKEMQMNLRKTPGYEKMSTEMPIAVQKVKEGNTLTTNKMQFLEMLCDLMVSEPYDAEVYIELMEGASIPTYAHATDAGADIYAKEDIVIPANARGVIVKTGLKMAIPVRWQLAIRPRSGLSHKTTIRIANAPGTIDCDYRDEVGVIIDNFSDEDVVFKKDDRIAQLILEKVFRAKFTPVESVADIGDNRGGGYGSTDKKN